MSNDEYYGLYASSLSIFEVITKVLYLNDIRYFVEKAESDDGMPIICAAIPKSEYSESEIKRISKKIDKALDSEGANYKKEGRLSEAKDEASTDDPVLAFTTYTLDWN